MQRDQIWWENDDRNVYDFRFCLSKLSCLTMVPECSWTVTVFYALSIYCPCFLFNLFSEFPGTRASEINFHELQASDNHGKLGVIIGCVFAGLVLLAAMVAGVYLARKRQMQLRRLEPTSSRNTSRQLMQTFLLRHWYLPVATYLWRHACMAEWSRRVAQGYEIYCHGWRS